MRRKFTKPMTEQQLQKLEAHCKKFVKKQRIHCPETIHQTDRVIENAYEFIEGVCKLVGYLPDEG